MFRFNGYQKHMVEVQHLHSVPFSHTLSSKHSHPVNHDYHIIWNSYDWNMQVYAGKPADCVPEKNQVKFVDDDCTAQGYKVM